jgi:hypothetical protein
MDQDKRQLWIAMSNLWLDTELTDEAIAEIAQVVRESKLGRAELEDVFRFELAPFLGKNHSSLAGVWEGFEPEWVCSEAQKLCGKRRLMDRVKASMGLTTYAARPAWKRVLESAFADSAG